MNLPLLITLIVVSLNLIIAAVILINSKKSLSSRYFFILTLSIAIWILANYFSNSVSNYYWSLVFNKLIFLSTTVFAWSFVIFSYYFPDDKKINSKFFWSYFSLFLIVAIITLSDFLVKDIQFRENITEINFAWGIYLYIVFLVGSIVWSLLRIFYKYFTVKNDNNLKSALKLVIIGFSLSAFFSLLTNLFLPVFFSNFELTNYIPLFIIILVGSVALAIFKFNFLKVKIVTAEIFVLFLITSVFINLFNYSNVIQFGFNFIIFFIVILFGIMFIKSILNELKKVEELENLNKKLRLTTIKLEKANQELQRLDDAKSEFLSIASHQLRTPITIIRGYISMMLEGSFGPLPPLIKENIKKVNAATERLLSLIESLLDISRLESGRLEFDIQPTDLVAITKELFDDFKNRAQEKKLKLEFYSPPNLPQVLADAKKIKEVISNLIDNAIKYTPQGGISINLHQEGTSVVFSIKDTGLGLESNDLSRIFNKFVRGKDIEKVHTEGTGLGLYFTRMVVENLGGRIWAESPGKNQGSTFSFSLPLVNKSQAKKIKSE